MHLLELKAESYALRRNGTSPFSSLSPLHSLGLLFSLICPRTAFCEWHVGLEGGIQ